MKITFDLPGWVDENQTLMLLSGQELVAFKEPGQEWRVKKDRCVQCGECCLDTPDGHTPFGSDDEDKCNALEKVGDKWLCTAGAKKPFRCLPDPNQKEYTGCSIRYF
ncbi:hypothetical protein KAR91_09535 [Candidatus Pacearchaeota archaeon]|nr:hypothetical protein [Candidatus Pacearchaeota archaeon]